MLPKNILVPTDFSAHAEAAFDYACELAVKLDATVHLVNVIGIPALGVPELGVAVTSAMIDSIVQQNQRASTSWWPAAAATRGSARPCSRPATRAS